MMVHDKTCIVTGSAQGIGKAIATKLLENGANVCISDINEKVGNDTLTELRIRFGDQRVHMVTCDVTKQEEFLELFNAAEKFFQVNCIDILVNNAGVIDNAGWKKCMDVNIMGVMIGGDIAFKRMSQSPTRGTIVNVSSAAGLFTGCHEMKGYSVSKHGVVTYTRAFAADFLEPGIDMKAICPLWVDTVMASRVVENASKKLATEMKKSIEITGGLLSPTDIAQSVFKLLTECETGTVMFSSKNTPCIIVPDIENTLLMLLTIMAKFVGKFTNKTLLSVRDQKILVVSFILFILFAVVVVF